MPHEYLRVYAPKLASRSDVPESHKEAIESLRRGVDARYDSDQIMFENCGCASVGGEAGGEYDYGWKAKTVLKCQYHGGPMKSLYTNLQELLELQKQKTQILESIDLLEKRGLMTPQQLQASILAEQNAKRQRQELESVLGSLSDEQKTLLASYFTKSHK